MENSLIGVLNGAATARAASVGMPVGAQLTLPFMVCCDWQWALVWNLSHWAMFRLLNYF